MRVCVKKSYWSSRDYNIRQRDRIRSYFKRKLIRKAKPKKIHASIPASPYAKKQHHKIKISKVIEFPNNINDCNTFIKECQDYSKHKISIDLRNLEKIDNISVLLLTANISIIFQDKLYRNKNMLPRNKDIDTQLTIIGFWDALCVNPPQDSKNTDFLRIKSLSGHKISDNGFHQDIINFFTKNHNHIGLEHKDGLFDAVFEACANSFEHAYDESDTNKRVWFLGSYDKAQDELEFIFYDIGMGIFQSLHNKKSYLGKLIKRYIRYAGKDNTLKRLCTTNLSKYKKNSGKIARGSGMISFKKFIDTIPHTRIANLEVITEDLFYSSYNNKVIRISKPIQGTLIRWTIGRLLQGATDD